MKKNPDHGRPSASPGTPHAKGAERARMQVVVLDASPAGVWTRIRGPLSGAWYGPWRFTPTNTEEGE